MIHTTFRLARESGACLASYRKMWRHLGGLSYGLDTPIGLDVVLEVLGFSDALWCLRCVLPGQAAERDRIARTFAEDAEDDAEDIIYDVVSVAWEAADAAADAAAQATDGDNRIVARYSAWLAEWARQRGRFLDLLNGPIPAEAP